MLTGCIAGNNKNLSHLPPFNRYVGHNVVLDRPVFVFYEKDYLTMPNYSIQEAPLRSFTLEDGQLRKHVDFGVDKLPAGQRVFIESVRLKVGFDTGAFQTALGKMTLPSKGAEVPFFFRWGVDRTLNRAPWEPSSTPERRSLSSEYR